MRKKAGINILLARMLVIILVIQMALPLNVMAAPSELQSDETEVEDTLLVEDSAEEVADEASSLEPVDVEETSNEEESETESEEVTEESLEPVTSEVTQEDLKAEDVETETWEGGFEVATIEGKVTLVKYVGDADEVHVPAPIEVIGYDAFGYHSPVKRLSFADSVKILELGAIDENQELEYLDLSNIEVLKSNSVTYCPNLKEIKLSKKIKEIPGGSSFYYNHGTKETLKVVIPKELEKLPENIVNYLTWFEPNTFEVEEGNPVYSVTDGVLYEKLEDGTKKLVRYPRIAGPSFVIPEDVTVIGQKAFSAFSGNELTISKNVKKIESLAFGNTEFKKITLLSTLTDVAKDAFQPNPAMPQDDSTFWADEWVISDAAAKMTSNSFYSVIRPYQLPRSKVKNNIYYKVTWMKDVTDLGICSNLQQGSKWDEVEEGNPVYYDKNDGNVYKYIKDADGKVTGSSLEIYPDKKDEVDTFTIPADVTVMNDEIRSVKTLIINDSVKTLKTYKGQKLVIPASRTESFCAQNNDGSTYDYSANYTEIEVEEGNKYFFVKDGVLYYRLSDADGNLTGELSIVACAVDSDETREIEKGVVRLDSNIEFGPGTLVLHELLPEIIDKKTKKYNGSETTKLVLADDFEEAISGKELDKFRALNTLEVAEENSLYSVNDKAILSKDGSELYAFALNNVDKKEYYIPNTVTTIRTNAIFTEDMEGYKDPIQKIILSNSVKDIQEDAIVIDSYWPSGNDVLQISAKYPGAADAFDDYALAWSGSGVTIYCLESEVEKFKGKFEDALVIGSSMEIEAPEQISNLKNVPVSGNYEPNTVVKVYVNGTYVKDVTTDANGDWNTTVDLPEGFYLDYWSVHVTNESGDDCSEPKYILWNGIVDILIPGIIRDANLPIVGTTLRDSEIDIYLDDEYVTTIKSDGLGQIKQSITVPNPVNNKFYKFHMVAKRDGKEFVSETSKFQYSEDFPIIESLFCNHLDITSPESFKGYIVYMPGEVVRYRIKTQDYENVKNMKFYISERMDIDSLMELDGVYLGDGEWEVEFVSKDQVPGALRIECELNDGRKDFIYAATYTFIIDPSGYVYEVTRDNVLEGVQVSIYYKETEKDTESILWDASVYDQINPMYTDEYGYYGWNVPKGYWKVVARESDYLDAESEWMSVPPIRTNVNLEMISTCAASIDTLYLYNDKAKVNFGRYMKADTITPDTFSVEGLGNVKSVTPYNEILYKGTWVAKEFLVEFEKSATAGRYYTFVTDAEKIETYAGIKGLQYPKYDTSISVRADIGLPEALCVPEVIAVPLDGSVTVDLSVKGQGDLSDFEFSLEEDWYADPKLLTFDDNSQYVDVATDSEGKASVTINGEEVGTTWVCVWTVFGEEKIRVEVVRSTAVADVLAEIYVPETDVPDIGGEGGDGQEDKIAITEEDFTIALNQTEFTYTGEAIEPIVTITDSEGEELIKDTDYTISYGDNVNVATAYLTIRGIGNYTGRIQKAFAINPVALTAENISWGQDVFKVTEYTPEEIAAESGLLPKVVVTVGDKILEAGKDYTIGTENNKQPGKAKATLTGIGNYSNYEETFEFEYTIEGIDLAKVKFDKIPTQNCVNGKCEVVPVVNAAYLEKNGLAGISFKTYYEKNDKPGTASVYLYGGEGTNTTGKKKMTFKIAAYKISGATITINNNRALTYTGSALKPSVTVYIEGKRLTQDKDYVIFYSNNVNVSKKDKKGVVQPSGKVTIKGKGAYTGSLTKNFVINPLSIGNGNALAKGFTMEESKLLKYTGKTVKPLPKLYYNGKVLKANKDYKVVVDKAATGTKDATANVAYKIEGYGNYTGSASASVVVTDEKYSVKLSVKGTKVYTGEAITLAYNTEIKVYNGKALLGENDGYTLEYLNNVNAGTAIIKVMSAGDNPITLTTASFKIAPQKLTSKNTVIEGISETPLAYTGKEQKPALTVKLNEKELSGSDYTISYSNNINPGNAKVTIKAKGNYSGTLTKTFKIDKMTEFSANYLQLDDSRTEYVTVTYYPEGKEDYRYLGTGYKLTENKEYKLKYSLVDETQWDGKVKRKLYAQVIPNKSYFKKVPKTQLKVAAYYYANTIDKVLSDIKPSLIKLQVYKNKPVTPKITLSFMGIKLVEGKDYEVNYINNDRRGVATAQITLKGWFPDKTIDIKYFIF